MTTEAKPTPGAMRAAEAIRLWYGSPEAEATRYLSDATELRTIAAIIDREAGAAEVLEALGDLHQQADRMNTRQHAGLELQPDEWSDLFRFCNIARAAIAKAERKG